MAHFENHCKIEIPSYSSERINYTEESIMKDYSFTEDQPNQTLSISINPDSNTNSTQGVSTPSGSS